MKLKIVLFIILALSVVINIIQFNSDPIIQTEIVTKIDTVFTFKTITNTIIADAKIDTVYITNGDSLEIQNITASYTHKIFQDFLFGKVDIEYSETFKTFAVSDSLTVMEKTILKHTKTTEYVERPFIQLLASTGIYVNPENEFNIMLGSGIRIADKFDVILTGKSDKQLGIVLVWRFK